jgi:uncharacterized protein YbjT (DUF2867 family)
MEILVTGGTGYVGAALIPRLLSRGHRVRALARPSSLSRVPAGAQAVSGDALDAGSVGAALRPEDTLIHLVGTPHPNPSKAAQFRAVDLVSIRASVAAALRVGPAHLVYVSVAQPAPVMRAYLAARAQGEQSIVQAGLTATILRPWYVLGPGHRWPVVLLPIYKLAEALPATRAGARRLGLVTLEQMVNALVYAVESPPPAGHRRVLDVPAIKRASESSGAEQP